MRVTTSIASPRPPVPRERLTTNTTGNSRPLAACTVMRFTASSGVDDGVGLVAAHQLVDALGDPRQRRVAAVLQPAHQAAQLLQVLARLGVAAAAELPGVGALVQHLVDELGRRQPVGQPAPARERLAGEAQQPLILGRQSRPAPAAARRRRAPRPPAARAASAPRSDSRTNRERRNAAAWRWLSGAARHCTSAMTSLTSSASKKPEPLVDVERHADALQLALELAVAVARAEQDGDVARPRSPGARRSGDRARSRRVPSRRATSAATARAQPAVSRAGHQTDADGVAAVAVADRKAVELAVAEGVAALRRLDDLVADVVDEQLQRRHGAEAAGRWRGAARAAGRSRPISRAASSSTPTSASRKP